MSKIYTVIALEDRHYLEKGEILKVKEKYNSDYDSDSYFKFAENGKLGVAGTFYPKDCFRILLESKNPEYFI